MLPTRVDAAEKEEAAMKKSDEAVEIAAATKKQDQEQTKEPEKVSKRAKRKARRLAREEKAKLASEQYKEWCKKKQAEMSEEEVMDPLAFEAKCFKQMWEEVYGSSHGNYEDTTCRFIEDSKSGASNYSTLQVISVKVSKIKGGLQWPLDVYGLIAARDSYDRRRNIIFERLRDDCQTLTEEDPYLALTGPIRPITVLDPVFFEASLYVRGTGNSDDDKELSLLVASCYHFCANQWVSGLDKRSYTSRLSTLDFNLGLIVGSVEATVSVTVVSAPPRGFSGEFVAFTTDVEDGVVLHKSGDKERHLAGDRVRLSRSALCVARAARLRVSVTACDGRGTGSGWVSLEAMEAGTSSAEVVVAGICRLEISVGSLFP